MLTIRNTQEQMRESVQMGVRYRPASTSRIASAPAPALNVPHKRCGRCSGRGGDFSLLMLFVHCQLSVRKKEKERFSQIQSEYRGGSTHIFLPNYYSEPLHHGPKTILRSLHSPHAMPRRVPRTAATSATHNTRNDSPGR